MLIEADGLFRFLVNKFNAQRVANGRRVMKDRRLLFCFELEADFSGTTDGVHTLVSVNVPSGHPLRSSKRTEDVGKSRWRPSSLLARDRRDFAAAHELLHTLTLPHTHRDSRLFSSGHTTEWTYLRISGISAKCKYLFPFKTTSNIMSYSDSAFTTWRWQWAIMQANAAIAPVDWDLGKEE
jgi:hypothetical protein